MKIINQNINESYTKMKNIIEKRKKCDEYIQSYINSIEQIKELLQNIN